MQKPEKKEGFFQKFRNELERWELEEKNGKTLDQFKKEMKERLSKEEGGVGLFDEIKNQFPRTYKLFSLVRNGTTNLFNDVKGTTILHFNLILGKRNILDFDLRELELLYVTLIQIKRMLPVCCLAILPFGNVFVFLAAYMKPITFLSPHFWTDEQKAMVIKLKHAKRVSIFLPIIQYLEINLPEQDDSQLVSKFRNLLISIQDGYVPNSIELASFKELFATKKMFAPEQLSSAHLENLITLHSLRSIAMKIHCLDEWASFIYLVDRFINRNGGVAQLTPEQLTEVNKYCFQRGANANEMTDEEMRDYLKQWLAFSEHIPSNCTSFLLHAPALIGFNHKSNQSVIDNSLL